MTLPEETPALPLDEDGGPVFAAPWEARVFAMTVAQNLSVILGGEMVLQPRFELKALLDAIEAGEPDSAEAA